MWLLVDCSCFYFIPNVVLDWLIVSRHWLFQIFWFWCWYGVLGGQCSLRGLPHVRSGFSKHVMVQKSSVSRNLTFFAKVTRDAKSQVFREKKIKTWLWNTFSPTCFEARTQNEFRLSIFKTGSMMVMLLEGVEHAKQQTRSRISRFRKTTLFTNYNTWFVWISLEILTKQTRNTIGFTVAENF